MTLIQRHIIPIVIPAFEPDKHLLDLVTHLQTMGFTLLIVNDGSKEKYAPIFNSIKASGAIVLQHQHNLGKGAALKTAFAYVNEQMPDCIGVVTADADGQHLPDDIAKIALQLMQQPSHLLLGCRYFAHNVPLRSKIGNIFTRNIFAALVGKKISDTQTGLRGIPRNLLPTLLTIKSQGYEFELEMLMYAIEHHIPISEYPITTVYENNNASSHFNPLLDSAKIYFVFLRFISIGVVTALLDLIIFALCYFFTGFIFFSETLARSSGGLFGFMMGKHVVFKSRGHSGKELLNFTILWLSLLFISYAMLRGAYFLGWNMYWSKILTQIILVTASFSIQRFIVFPYSPKTT